MTRATSDASSSKGSSSSNRERSARAYYDDFSVTYDRGRDRGYHGLIDELELEVVRPYASNARVLEIGCGTGLVLSRIAQHAELAVGIDPSAGMIAGARQRGLHVLRASAAALPFADESFDCVCSFKVLAHVDPLGPALAEAARVTRPGGHLVLELYNALSLRYLARLAAGARRIGRAHTEADVPTRWDLPWAVRAQLPRSVELVDLRGVRVLTPAARLHDLPVIGPALARAERAASRSPLRVLGGFLIAIARKRGSGGR